MPLCLATAFATLAYFLLIPAFASAASCPSGSRIITSGNLQNEVNSTATGGTLCLNGGSYSLGSTVSVSTSMTIVGVGYPSITQTFSGWMFDVTAANVTIRGLKMTGANRNRTGESCSGTGAIRYHAVRGASILDNEVNSFLCGINLNATNGFIVRNNLLTNIKYATIVGSAASNGTVDRNTVINVDHDGALGENAYGIVMSTSGSIPSSKIIISYNYVKNAPTWECYDSHDGQSIHWYGNVGIGCAMVGINQAYSGVRQITDSLADRNFLDGKGLLRPENSIVTTGTGEIVNNTIRNYPGGKCYISGQRAKISGNRCTSGVADIIPPSVPTGLSATAVSRRQIKLSWNASTDNVSVTGYDIYRNGSLVASITRTAYDDRGLAGNTTYHYAVSAKDAAGNVSVVRALAVSETTGH